jgi:polyisoprenoid-binding protein YceI
MKRHSQRFASVMAITAAAAFAAADAAKSGGEPMNVTVESGTASFVADTNVPAISVKGKSSSLEAHAVLRRAAGGLEVEHIEARLPVKSLATGMGLRDAHMRKYIFTTADGQVPDLTFEAGSAACSNGSCRVTGNLSVRGTAHAFTLPLKIHEEGGGFRAAGKAVVRLSDYGIERPSQFGVKTTDEVQLQFEFMAKPAATQMSSAAGGSR